MPPESDIPPYAHLGPELILEAVEALGLISDGRILALNSYENRVYQVGIEAGTPVVVKFYRPARWSDEAIEEEHRFCLELAAREIPVVPPEQVNGRTLHHHGGYRYAVFARRGGRGPDLSLLEHRQWIGRFLGRIHAVGALKRFTHRPRIEVQAWGHDSARFLLEGGFIPAHIETAYQSLSEDLLRDVAQCFQLAAPYRELRLHGDCHPGNILWTDTGPHFVDFDDCRTGPAIQDLWMLLSGERAEMQGQLLDILEGYTQFAEFDPRELQLIEALRTLRIMHYAAWIARRWHDPAFPMAFPWFDSPRYWEEHVLALREQAALLNEPPLVV